MRKFFPLSIIMIALIASMVTCKKEETPKEPEQTAGTSAGPLVISRLSAAPKQKPVAFDHTAHKKNAAASGKTCKTCHHKGTISQKCSTPGCHAGPGAEKLVHKKCYGECHLTASDAPRQAQCGGCHK